jgi:hypothetical protein
MTMRFKQKDDSHQRAIFREGFAGLDEELVFA